MIEDIQHIKTTKKDLRKFGLALGIILISIGCFLFWDKKLTFQYFFTVGIFFLCFAGVYPTIFKPIYWAWMCMATIIAWIMTRLILSLLFYFVLTPIALISRIFGKQFLELKWNKTQETYWNFRPMKELKNNSYKKQF